MPVPPSESQPAAAPHGKPSPVEELKRNSHHLRGAIAAELGSATDSVSKPTGTLLKFHGTYQQDDRDWRKRMSVKSYSFMVRVSLPGGVLNPEKYLALDALADTAGDGTLRITARGGLQYHYVGKRALRDCIRAVNDAGAFNICRLRRRGAQYRCAGRAVRDAPTPPAG